MSHRFHFFRVGGVDQVSLRDRHDLFALRDLDQQLWVALAMPTTGVDIDRETLELLDHDGDGRIRVNDILEAIDWAKTAFTDPGDLLKSVAEVHLVAIADPRILAAAKRMLVDLGKPHELTISVADTAAITKAFSDTLLNGDGIVIPQSTADADLTRLIEDVITCIGSVTDRSGRPGVDAKLTEQFFAEVDKRAGWMGRGSDAALAPLGAGTPAAADALAAVRAKIEDYFVRCRVATYDPRGADALAGQDAELVALASRTLTPSDEELGRLPLARIDATGGIPLGPAINPAWSSRMETFAKAAIEPILGVRGSLTAAEFQTISDRLAGFEAWRADRPTTTVDGLDPAWVERLAAPELRVRLAALIAEDAALAAEYDQISAVVKTVRMQRDFARVVRNFVNFSDFYSKQDGAFQVGTLYLDARALHLCVPVENAAKHSALATSADACLIYCDLSRQGAKRQIAAALTNGDADNVFVGRNGVFYDRDGNDWDATVTKVIDNPISVRQAFWSPYKKLIRAIEDSVHKRARAAEADSTKKLEATGAEAVNVDKKALAVAAASGKDSKPAKIDLGTVAAIGVAIGGIGTLFGVLMSNLFGLGMWLPVGVFAILLMISGPSMLLAWLKLRRRNLGPILDANGWAINGRARINVAFGAAMTELAKLPRGAKRSLDDPFADKHRPWKLYIALAALVVLAGTWYVGKLDPYLPRSARSIHVLGKHAPAYRKVVPDTAPPAAPPVKP